MFWYIKISRSEIFSCLHVCCYSISNMWNNFWLPNWMYNFVHDLSFIRKLNGVYSNTSRNQIKSLTHYYHRYMWDTSSKCLGYVDFFGYVKWSVWDVSHVSDMDMVSSSKWQCFIAMMYRCKYWRQDMDLRTCKSLNARIHRHNTQLCVFMHVSIFNTHQNLQ